MSLQRSLVAIVGPTASGKTAVAIETASLLDGEVINADSMQIWKGLDIGTAKPTSAERSQAVFHLIDFLDFDQNYSAADFQKSASLVNADILNRNKSVILCGGTGLYIRSVVDDLGFPPQAKSEVRQRWKEFFEAHGSQALHDRLREVDSESAERLAAADTKRIIRALEVFETSGRTLSSFIEEDRVKRQKTKWTQFGLFFETDELVQRINKRVDLMIEQGFEHEVRSLYEKGLRKNLQSCTALGYQEMVNYIEGRHSLEDAIELIKTNTRRFAKRQRTWFRADDRIIWLKASEMTAKELAESIVARLFSATC